MSFAVTYVALKLKELFRSKIYLAFTAFILLLALGMALLLPRTDQNSPYTLAVLNEQQTKLGVAVVDALNHDGGYRLRICKDRRELEALVLSGEVLCGYIFDEKADQRIEDSRYTGLMDSYYREKSPAAALCDEAVCGAAFNYISPLVAVKYLEDKNLSGTDELQGLKDNFAVAVSGENMMRVTLLGAEGQAMESGDSSVITVFLYSIFCSMTLVFAIITAFYTQSIDKSLASLGQKPVLVGLCSFLSYSISYIVILTAAHIIIGFLMPALLYELDILLKIILTGIIGGVLQLFSRRFLSPSVLPLLPFAAVLLVAVTSL